MLRLRLATFADEPAMRALMQRAIGDLLTPYLAPDAVCASYEVMGLDTQLIADNTYFAACDGDAIVGCGGWSRRATLFGGDHTRGRDAALLDPARDAARIRAMYTDPAHTRRGVGRLILEACESAARKQGFVRVEMAATLAGEPLYRACGYVEIERFSAAAGNGVRVPLLRMGKSL